jgi:glycosyltransferase involved in cell wall biosynthesis
MIYTPKITILTLCYNNAAQVMGTLEAVKNQDYTNIEHLILDDCSTNNSFNELEKWIENNHYNGKIYRNNRNLGICKSLNKLIKLATGELMACNCDDLWDSNHLSTNIELLISQKADVLYSNVAVIDNNNNFQFYYQDVLNYNGYLGKEKLLLDVKNSYKILDNKEVIDALFYTNFLHPITLITYVKNIENSGYYDENLPFEDYDMNFRLCQNLSIIYNAKCTSKYIKHPNSFTVSPHRKIQLNNGIINTLIKQKHLLITPNSKEKYDKAIYNSSLIITALKPQLIINYATLMFNNLTNKSLIIPFVFTYFKDILKKILRGLFPKF